MSEFTNGHAGVPIPSVESRCGFCIARQIPCDCDPRWKGTGHPERHPCAECARLLRHDEMCGRGDSQREKGDER